jgi:hypothetical protein
LGNIVFNRKNPRVNSKTIVGLSLNVSNRLWSSESRFIKCLSVFGCVS